MTAFPITSGEDAKFRRWFTELYEELSALPLYQSLNLPPVAQSHNGYFAQEKGTARDSTEGRSTRADDDAYNLIMRDKETLLSRDTPLRFIFSHSALREGWDNPNVFQICTLNETRSEMKKRQEIGRGLRLPVRENGLRSFDPNVNRLTVIANESYEQFARQLQTEMEEDCGVNFAGRIQNKRDRRRAVLKEGWQLDPDFRLLWERIRHKTRYEVDYDGEELIQRAAHEVGGMSVVEAPKFRVTKNLVAFGKDEITGTLRGIREEKDAAYVTKTTIPDLLTYLQSETELTRTTLAEILIRSGRLNDVAENPQQFLTLSLAAIRRVQQAIMVQGIQYHRIPHSGYEMTLFEEKELNGYLSRLIEVNHSIYDVIEWESGIEYEFAKNLDTLESVPLFVKLPDWFKIDTPLGTYNPDWAMVMQRDERVCLVRETKGTREVSQLRESEQQKIRCGRKHFEALGVDYAVTETVLGIT